MFVPLSLRTSHLIYHPHSLRSGIRKCSSMPGYPVLIVYVSGEQVILCTRYFLEGNLHIFDLLFLIFTFAGHPLQTFPDE